MNKFRETDFDEISAYYEETNEYYMELLNIIVQHPDFVAVKGLKSYKDIQGEYFIAIESAHKFCVGKAAELGNEIMLKWSRNHPKEDIFSHCRVFIHPLNDIYKESTKLNIPDKFLINDLSDITFGGENNMDSSHIDKIKNKLDNIDKKKAAIATGSAIAFMSALAIARTLFKHRKNH